MENSALIDKGKSYTTQIVIVSVVIPVVVAVLIFAPWKLETTGSWVKVLPHLNGVVNSITAILLVLAVIAVKQGKIRLHKSLMISAFSLGAMFLVSYVIYHASSDSTVFGDVNGDGILDDAEKLEVGSSRGYYLILLLSHILLATIVIPLVLFSMYYSLTDKIEKHKKIVKFTFPVWLYVSITGVVVYLMISPYY